jgi:hypothetical protein
MFFLHLFLIKKNMKTTTFVVLLMILFYQFNFAQTYLLTEDFSSIVSGNSSSTSGSSSAWTGNANITSVSTAYSAGGSVKIGSGSATGFIQTKVLDLSVNGGSFSIDFDVKGWTTIEGSIILTVTNLATQTVAYSAVMASSSFETKTMNFSGGTANSVIKIATTSKRAFIDNVKVYYAVSTLPVELVSFAANCEDNNTVSVNWTTALEHNSDYFIVEKSRDGLNWNVLVTKAAAGNSTQLLNYSVVDASDINRTVYYRLTQVDVDGASKVYDIVSTNCFAEKELTLLAYPNPSNGQFSLKIENAKVGKYDLAITDMQGKTIEEQSIDLESGTTVVKLNPLGLQPGVYMLQFMQNGNVLQYQKLVIE